MKYLSFFMVLAVSCLTGRADSVSDIPIRGYFYASGKTRFEIELDPQLLKHPETESSVSYSALQLLSEEEKQALVDATVEFISVRFDLVFEPSKGVKYPKFEVSFVTDEGKALEKPDDPVVLFATWETVLPESVETYQLKVKNTGESRVVSENYVNNQLVEEGASILVSGSESPILALPERITEQEIRSLMTRPLLFGLGLLLVFLLLRSLRR